MMPRVTSLAKAEKPAPKGGASGVEKVASKSRNAGNPAGGYEGGASGEETPAYSGTYGNEARHRLLVWNQESEARR